MQPHATQDLRFGLFFSPVHSPEVNPTAALERDSELIIRADDLGFDEAWIGEHHSTGWEYVAAPDLVIANLLARTKRIKLGTGVVSLPYHHPFNVAERMVLLDHIGRGRVMFGVGPGALPYDARMLGIDPMDTRRMMQESLEVILALLEGERVTRHTDWFTVHEAMLQLPNFTKPHLEVAVSGTHSPTGPRLAGRFGTGLLMFNATAAAGYEALADHWNVVIEQAEEHGQRVDRGGWRLVAPMHIAETREIARREVRAGLGRWCHYMRNVATLSILPDSTDLEESIDALVDSGFAVIGSPDDAIEQVARLQQRSGGFGALLVWANDWADSAASRRSIELIASEVTPAFKGSRERLREAEQWAVGLQPDLAPVAAAARRQATEDYAIERKTLVDRHLT
jgi:limonene 1,2-monooxygenase